MRDSFIFWQKQVMEIRKFSFESSERIVRKLFDKWLVRTDMQTEEPIEQLGCLKGDNVYPTNDFQ